MCFTGKKIKTGRDSSEILTAKRVISSALIFSFYVFLHFLPFPWLCITFIINTVWNIKENLSYCSKSSFEFGQLLLSWVLFVKGWFGEVWDFRMCCFFSFLEVTVNRSLAAPASRADGQLERRPGRICITHLLEGILSFVE